MERINTDYNNKINQPKISHKSIDKYLSGLPEKERKVLGNLRNTIKSVVPEAEETISYQIPVFKYKGMLVGFAAFKKHCSLFEMGKDVMKNFENELKKYSKEKATVRFTVDKPLPVSLIKKLVKARVKENEIRFKNRK